MVQFVKITGPAAWASYLINGDASGLEDGEQAKADAWLSRNELRQIVSDASGEDDDPQEPRFTRHMALYCREIDCEGGDVLDYVAEPMETATWPKSAFL